MANWSTPLPYIYVAPDGKIYKKVGTPDGGIPSFGYDELGELIYKYSEGQTQYGFAIDTDGNLNSTAQFDIDEYGNINNSSEWELMPDVAVTASRQRDLDLLRSHNKVIKMKVTLLDEYYRQVESLVGLIKGSPSYEIDSDSDIRRTCAITLSVPSKEQIELDFEKTWNRRMVELSCGIYCAEISDYVWYPLGRMLMSNGDSTYDATTQDIKLNLVDLMASMTEERGNQISGTYLFQAGDDLHDLVEDFVGENTPYCNNMSICDFDEETMPYDIETNVGDYPITGLHNIFDLFPYYEFFYDRDGHFTAQMIPTKISDPVDIGTTVLDDLLISEKKTVDFANIKNTTEIWGRSLSSDYVATSCISENNNYRYKVTIDETFTELVSGETYTILPETTSLLGQTMKIQDTTEYGIYIANGAATEYTPIEAGAMKAGVAYSLRYFEEKFVLQGELLVRCIVQEITEEPSAAVKQAYKEFHACDNVKWIVNPDSPFACTLNENTGAIQGEMRQVLNGGEYENIYTTQLAYERAIYENWIKCRNQDKVEIETILIPWMDVNDKIQYISPVTGEMGTWLVKGISYDFKDWTMTVKADRFYPYYPWQE